MRSDFTTADSSSRRAAGDWQTPHALAAAVVATLDIDPSTIIEPTCGVGGFLAAAQTRFPSAALQGFDVNADHLARAAAAVPSAHFAHADFFATDWDIVLRDAVEPILVLGNPPWVSTSTLGALGAKNAPARANFKGMSGFDAMTGASDFDVSEWMILRLLDALRGRRFTLAFLCKTAVCRRVLERTRLKGTIRRIDAKEHFRAGVDAALLVLEGRAADEWPVFASLEAKRPQSKLAVIDDVLCADAAAYRATSHLAGNCQPTWRSGVKHDCSAVMELRKDGHAWVNGLGEAVDVEAHVLFPLLKCTDVFHDRKAERRLIVPQRTLGEDTSALKHSAPRAYRYLRRHRDRLAARKSSIYVGRPPFSIFGVGDYTFAPWKIAVSGLHKRLVFSLVGPEPTVLDDTCYFLPFQSERQAKRALRVLRSEAAQQFFFARIFWDAKRPIQKRVLQTFDLLKAEAGL